MAKGGSGTMRRWLWLAAAIVAVDQLTKFAILRSFSFGERMAVVPGLFDLTLVYNRGAAFSFLAGASGWQRWFFTALGVAAAIFIVWLLARHGSQRLFSLALALILGGAIGNVIDRVARGQVVDFLLVYWQRWHWPAFNVADSAITVGAVLLIVDEFRRVRRGR
ncbi:MAG: signal peptidase II [Burkholderiaceae bacterium]|nr:signal peptidase II [Burkholderiaceae bacterium]